MATQDLLNYRFKADLAKFQLIVDLNTRDFIRRITFDLWNRIIKRTPVDTGRARASWGVVIDSFAIEVPPEGTYAPPPPPAEIHVIDGTKTVAIISALDYIQALEDGHSARKPEGMIRVSLEEMALEINAVIAAAAGSH